MVNFYFFNIYIYIYIYPSANKISTVLYYEIDSWLRLPKKKYKYISCSLGCTDIFRWKFALFIYRQKEVKQNHIGIFSNEINFMQSH